MADALLSKAGPLYDEAVTQLSKTCPLYTEAGRGTVTQLSKTVRLAEAL